MTTRIPFASSPALRSIGRRFIGVGDLLTHMAPHIGLHLKQSGITREYNMSAREYLSVCFIVSLLYGVAASALLYVIFNVIEKNTMLGVSMGVLIGLIMYVYLLIYPKYIVNRRIKMIEKNLIFSLRNILIEIRSGVPVFDALVAVSNRDFGAISEELSIVVEKVSSGTQIIQALEELAVRNPSPYFRRALWQIVNSMKAGSDLGDNLAEVVKTLSKEQLVEVKEYKSRLNPLSMMYMMIAVIMPSMGVTVLLVLSSLPGMGDIANESTLWTLLAVVVVLQVIFMGIIKSQRPNLLGS